MARPIANDIFFPALEALLREGKSVSFTPRGTSMRPFIEGGRDSVTVSPLAGSVRVGDIVLAHVGDDYILHRIYQIAPPADLPHTQQYTNPQRTEQYTNPQHTQQYTKYQHTEQYTNLKLTDPHAAPQYILMGDGNIEQQESCRAADILGRVTQITSPSGKRTLPTRAALWRHLLPLRPLLLKIYKFFA